MATQTEPRLLSTIPPPSPPLSDGEGRETREDLATTARTVEGAARERCATKGPTPPGSEPDRRGRIEDTTELGLTGDDTLGDGFVERNAPGFEESNDARPPPGQSRVAAKDNEPEPEPTFPQTTEAPPRPQALDRMRYGESHYLEPATPTQPLLELSPTPMTFPAHIHTSAPHSLSPHAASPAAVSASANGGDSSRSLVASPPYWQAQAQQPGHPRPASWASTDSVNFAGITLCDNEIDARNAACWAKSVTIRDYTIVNGSSTIPSVFRPALARVGSSRPVSRSGGGVVHPATSPVEEATDAGWLGSGNMKATLGMGGIGAFVVFNVVIDTLDGGTFEIKRRYSEFDSLRSRLVQTFPRFEKAMPMLPPKSVVSRFRPKFLEQRRRGLEYFLSCVLLNPEFAGSPVTKEFIFA